MNKGKKMSRASLMVRTFAAAAIAVLFLGCSSSNSQAPQINAVGNHPADWVTTHPTAFFQNAAQCTPCHGSYTDPNAAGGTSKVSCFGCHHPNGPAHPAGWVGYLQHGLQGAMAAPGATSGMAYCQSCHGTDYSSGPAPSCLACHNTGAPHPSAAAWTNPADTANLFHGFTDPGNAAACFQCHANGNNSSLKPSIPPVAGAAPGCTNNTMCHDNRVGGSL